MEGRTEIYIDWKRRIVEQINRDLTTAATPLIDELLTLVPGTSWSRIAEVASALQQLAPKPANGPLFEVSQQSMADIKSTLDDYKNNTGLRLESGGVSFRHVDDHEFAGIAIGMSCEPWQRQIEESLGHPVRIEVVIRCDDQDGRTEAELTGACYLECTDLLVYSVASERYWAAPLTWTSMRFTS